jgi:hypothetical protein
MTCFELLLRITNPLRITSLALSALAVWLFVAPAWAADPLAFPLDEPAFPAQLAIIDAEWNVQFRAGDKLRVVGAIDLAYWGRYYDDEHGPQIVLRDGSLIRADVLSLDDKELILGDATGLGRGQWEQSSIPRSSVWAILFQPPAGPQQRSELLRALDSGPDFQDRLLLSGGESVGGGILAVPSAGAFAPEQVKPGSETFSIVQRNVLEPLAIPAAKVVALRFQGIAAGRSTVGAAWLGLTDGSLVNARSIAVKGDQVTISLAGGGSLKTTLSGRDDPNETFWNAVTYLQPASPRVRYLSEQESLGYKHIPFLSVERPLARDANVLGHKLRAGKAVFLQGLGMPSTSRVAYDLSGYRRFAAEIALDDAAGNRGSVTFKVLLESAPSEWSVAYESTVVRGGDPPRAISVELKGAQRMALIVDFADRGDEADYADWLNARLTK